MANTNPGKRARSAIFSLLLLPALVACARSPIIDLGAVLDPPVAASVPGVYNERFDLELSHERKDADIRWTTSATADISDVAAWTDYTAPIDMNASSTVRAYAYVDEANPSGIVSFEYTMQPAAPVIIGAPAASSWMTITITCSTLSTAIYYTTDGQEPLSLTSTPIEYSGPFDIEETATVRAAAVRLIATTQLEDAGWTRSARSLASMEVDTAGTVLSTPTFSAAGGAYPDNFDLSLSSADAVADPDVVIRYTLDGTIPTARLNGTDYTAPIPVSDSMTIRARTFRWGRTSSPSATGNYSLVPAAPTFSASGGTFPNDLSLTLGSVTPGTVIRYTLDGSDPTETTGFVYASSILLPPATAAPWSGAVRAAAFRSGWTANASPVSATGVFAFTSTAPAIDLLSGNFTAVQTANITNTSPGATVGATIRYSTDGNAVTADSPGVGGAIAVDRSLTLRTAAFKPGYAQSAETTRNYVLGIGGTLSATPPGATFDEGRTVTLALSAPLPPEPFTILYTLDGSAPAPGDPDTTVYYSPFWLEAGTDLRARAVKDGWTDSSELSQTYNFVVADPTVDPPGGSFSNNATVTLASPTAGATIRYTLDTTGPATSSDGFAYSGPFVLAEEGTVTARAFRTGWLDSGTGAASFAFGAAAVSFDPPAGTYGVATELRLESATAGATILYTTDGSDPADVLNPQATEYSAPVLLDGATAIRTIARRSGYQDSAENGASYLFQLAAPIIGPNASLIYPNAIALYLNAAAGATIRYTLDGTSVDAADTVFGSTDLVMLPAGAGTGTVTVNARAFRAGWLDSSTASTAYIFRSATPVPTPPGGVQSGAVLVTLSTATAGAVIRYNLDSLDDLLESGGSATTYAGPILISADNTTLRATAFAAGFQQSDIATAVYDLP